MADENRPRYEVQLHVHVDKREYEIIHDAAHSPHRLRGINRFPEQLFVPLKGSGEEVFIFAQRVRTPGMKLSMGNDN